MSKTSELNALAHDKARKGRLNSRSNNGGWITLELGNGSARLGQSR